MPTTAEKNINTLTITTEDGHAVIYKSDGSAAVVDTRPWTRGRRVIKTTSSTAYTLGASDAGKMIVHTSASDSTLTIQADASLSWAVGECVEIMRNGAGNLQVIASGITLKDAGKPKANVSGSVFTLRKTAANAWVMWGDTKA
ncbi:hypothetical protein [Brevifollis gellanilyticus]|uniref:Uncharacterized protein n=1 Tax=Brevifollis gellanilyticus TaxID=748831 RepID=A0A512MHH5_9BACT|nr:hypothetical protein [Brevifollis gellanilyticus]GEP46174.1 hypothetical protein BGE01nite_54650 [Brevifollis gellanilyticus]